jgi:hypothetical protein
LRLQGALERSLALPACNITIRRWLAVSQELSPLLTQNLPVL